ncbi:hypothetical protein CEUSTIGMA_g3471.t1 [Chlamydomonas eustigma]|uniref:protein-tyrosine-phosphatase n=1 Tax=Chlamydomonas eustigma TaxID=1157962 RepID=A0A250WYW0_9CHLO|nr:hypothetical protein CEUSTIGMA_g3471.t1 [Chlamydomonas eustigma]|eukprot:GAX76028.1 hypothetical protein CEUSTIGMA_g3471.t1 [Chlamydomonas eustigma]
MDNSHFIHSEQQTVNCSCPEFQLVAPNLDSTSSAKCTGIQQPPREGRDAEALSCIETSSHKYEQNQIYKGPLHGASSNLALSHDRIISLRLTSPSVNFTQLPNIVIPDLIKYPEGDQMQAIMQIEPAKILSKAGEYAGTILDSERAYNPLEDYSLEDVVQHEHHNADPHGGILPCTQGRAAAATSMGVSGTNVRSLEPDISGGMGCAHAHITSDVQLIPEVEGNSIQKRQRLNDVSESVQSTVVRRRKVVFVWDLDETLIIFNSLLNGTFNSEADSEIKQEGMRVAQAFATVLFDLLDHYYQFPTVEEEDPISMEEALAPHTPFPAEVSLSAQIYERARVLYEGGLDGMKMRLGQTEKQRMEDCWKDLEAASRGWTTAAAALLQSTSEKISSERKQCTGKLSDLEREQCTGKLSDLEREQCTGKLSDLEMHHCVVSRGHLLATLVKLQAFGLSQHIHWSNIFSASKASKLDCFKMICDRFGPDARYCAVGDAPEEYQAAVALGWLFLKINPTIPLHLKLSSDVSDVTSTGCNSCPAELGIYKDLGGWRSVAGVSLFELNADLLLNDIV